MRNDVSHCRARPDTPKFLSSRCNSIEWSTQSNAADISRDRAALLDECLRRSTRRTERVPWLSPYCDVSCRQTGTEVADLLQPNNHLAAEQVLRSQVQVQVLEVQAQVQVLRSQVQVQVLKIGT